MCGLVGFIPRDLKKGINLEKLILLSVANEERGTDGWGISIEDKVIKNIGKAREFFALNRTEIYKNKDKGLFKGKKSYIPHSQSVCRK